MSVDNILGRRRIGWRQFGGSRSLLENSGGAFASDGKVARDLMDIEGSPTYVADIWLGIMLVGIGCGAEAESCGGRKRLFSWDQRLLEIFGQGPCRFVIFGLG